MDLQKDVKIKLALIHQMKQSLTDFGQPIISVRIFQIPQCME
jgi:hypothetical protein